MRTGEIARISNRLPFSMGTIRFFVACLLKNKCYTKIDSELIIGLLKFCSEREILPSELVGYLYDLKLKGIINYKLKP